jgi:hypothetical protein
MEIKDFFCIKGFPTFDLINATTLAAFLDFADKHIELNKVM